MVTSQIARWLLLLQEFDFKVVYKPSKIHFLPNHLSRISHGGPAERVVDQLPNAHLFNVVSPKRKRAKQQPDPLFNTP